MPMLLAVYAACPHCERHCQVVLVVAGLLCFIVKANLDTSKCLGLTHFKWPKFGAHFLWQVKTVMKLHIFIIHGMKEVRLSV